MKPTRTWTSHIPAAFFLAAWFITGNLVNAQQPLYDPTAESIFQRGVSEFDHALYRGSIAAFDSVISIDPNTHRTTAAFVMKAKAFYALNEYYDASKVARSFLTRFPSSRYVADVQLLLAKIYLRIDRFDEARQNALQAWRTLPPDPDASLVRQVLALVDSIFVYHTPLDGLYNAVKWGISPAERAHLWTLVAQREMGRGNLTAASVAIDSLAARYSGSVTSDVISRLRARLTTVSTIKIAVLLPLNRGEPDSPVKEIGTSTEEGIATAFQEFMDGVGKSLQLSLVTEDTQHDIQVATEKARALARDTTVVAILGPIYSNEAIAAARVAAANGLPLVTPTANQNGIAALGQTIFQANPDYEQRGRAVARYAVQNLGCRTVGVLAPSDTYAKFLADGFVKEAKEEGANVAVMQWYQKGMSDLRAQFTAIRAAALQQTAEPLVSFAGKMSRQDVMNLVRLGLPVRRVDSLMEKGGKVPARWLLGPRGKDLLDSIGIKMIYDQSYVDSTNIPVTGIEALYCPISGPEEIGIISSQLVYNNIKTHFLGSGEWNSLPDLEANRRYSSGIQFESDTYVDSSSQAFREFSSAFSARYGKAPDRFAIYGHDVASLVLEQIAKGATSRIPLAKALAAVNGFQGVRGRIGFSEGRVNAWIHILQYSGDATRHVAEVHGSPLGSATVK